MFTKEWEVSVTLEDGVFVGVLVLEAETEEEAKRYALAQIASSGLVLPYDLDVDDKEITAVVTGVYGGRV